MDIHRIYKLFFKYFRTKRMRNFVHTFSPTPLTRILDVGGTPDSWNIIKSDSQITLLNLRLPRNAASQPKNYSFVHGDARALQYSDGAFDIAYSNSVIEHVGTFDEQWKFASEICRVGKKVWIQTPAREFFVEPHFITPFIHYLPKKWQKHLLRNFTVWGWLTRPNQNQVEEFLSGIRLLTYAEMKDLFPDCDIRTERFLGLTKSYIAVRQ